VTTTLTPDIGTSITQTVQTAVAPGASVSTFLIWTVPASTPHSVNVVIVLDPQQIQADSDRSNNSVSMKIARPDLAIDAVQSERRSDGFRFIVRIANLGSVAASAANLSVGGSSGTTRASQSVPSLKPGETFDVALNVSGQFHDGRVLLSLGRSDDDFNVTNNDREIAVESETRKRAVGH
jgi:subtilase family serine protease